MPRDRVHLLQPHYDQTAIANVIADLDNAEDVPPAEAGTHRQLITLGRRDGTGAIFEALQERVTYRVNAVRQQSALRRLMGLGQALSRPSWAPGSARFWSRSWKIRPSSAGCATSTANPGHWKFLVSVRPRVLAVTGNTQLDQVFEAHADPDWCR